jgi:hypothetical protein
MDDYMHHIISVFIVGTISIVFPFGRTLGAVSFFLCGLPGGIDYLLLSLVKHNLIESITEKKINSNLNLLIRVPGVLLTTTAGVVSVMRGGKNVAIHPIWIILVAVLDNANSFYYCNRVVGNYHVTLAKMKPSKKDE